MLNLEFAHSTPVSGGGNLQFPNMARECLETFCPPVNLSNHDEGFSLAETDAALLTSAGHEQLSLAEHTNVYNSTDNAALTP